MTMHPSQNAGNGDDKSGPCASLDFTHSRGTYRKKHCNSDEQDGLHAPDSIPRLTS